MDNQTKSSLPQIIRQSFTDHKQEWCEVPYAVNQFRHDLITNQGEIRSLSGELFTIFLS